MANTTLLQVRTSPEDKRKASAILENLGTNLSSVVNMLIKQIILTESIPFDIKLNHSVYAKEELVKEVSATMALENMALTEEEIQLLNACLSGETSIEIERNKLLEELKNGR